MRTWGGSGVPTPSRAAAGGTGPARTCVSGINLQDGDKSGRNRGQIGVCGWSRPVVTLCFSKRLTRGQTGTRRRDRRNEAGRAGGPDPRRGGSRARWDGVTLTGPRWSRPHEGTGAWGAAGGGLLGRPDLTAHTPRARAAAPTAASPLAACSGWRGGFESPDVSCPRTLGDRAARGRVRRPLPLGQGTKKTPHVERFREGGTGTLCDWH